MTLKPVLTAGALFAVLLTLSGCSAGLSTGDKQICAAAYDEDARGVWEIQSLAENEEISKQAQRIKIGSSEQNDEEAMAAIRTLCEQSGYSAAEAEG